MKSRKLKVCGLTEANQITELASNPTISFIGFIFYEKSPRYIGKDAVIPPKTNGEQRVGVFVNATKQEIKTTIRDYELDLVQLHGNETPKFCSDLINDGIIVSKAFGINAIEDLDQLKKYDNLGIVHFVLDTKTKNYGGSGEKYDWNILQHYDFATPYLLSGGIRPTDKEKLEQISLPNCIGYDINSQFELSPGVKCMELVESFIRG
jgi:phosphoribosylanthranilate isomerase